MTRITNKHRARWAEHALLAYATGKEGGEELYDDMAIVLADLLCDLMHLADRERIHFAACTEGAATHFEAEKTEENPAHRYIAALTDAVGALRRIADTVHYENGEPVTALESREIEQIHADASGQLEDFDAILADAGRPK